jgi:EAL domain-containing protein (putative c-di-GMP-specific phosphodiesterase class I)/CheY-like chemotaxis protein
VLIAEDDPNVREALAEIIRSEPTFDLVGAAVDATEAIELADAERPDVALLDVRMPGGGGEAAAKGIRRCSPETKLIALSGHDDRGTVRAMLQAGVVGYLVKGGSIEEIVEAIKRAAAGQGSLSSEVTSDIIRALTGQLRVKSRASETRRAAKARIRHAVEDEDAFAMVFQPIVALRGREVVGAEALARFAGPSKRTPDAWFAEAADVGLGVELELAAVRKALEASDQLPANVYLTVNVSPTTLAKTRLCKLVAETCGERLVAEITEHALVQDYDRVSGALAKLRALGMRIAVDDAGAGFASLRHILNLSPELIKLDLTLIRDIDRDRSKQALAAGLISFAQKSGATVIAEGIERAPEVKTLVELGVGYGQGYFLGRPAPLPLSDLTTSRPLVPSHQH